MIAREARLMVAAMAFLTRLPIARWVGYSDEDLNRSSRYFSLVGIGVGFVAAAVYLASAAVFPPLIAVILSMAATVLATGGLHEDGLADTCDAFGGAMTRQDVLRILEDSRIGVFGALGLVFCLALKASSLAYLPASVVPIALLCAHGSSRAICVLTMALGRYARKEGGKTRPVAAGVRGTDAAVALLLGLVPFAFAPASLLWAVPVMLAVAGVMYLYFRARVGGYTGDCLGAVQQLTELVCYITLLGLP